MEHTSKISKNYSNKYSIMWGDVRICESKRGRVMALAEKSKILTFGGTGYIGK